MNAPGTDPRLPGHDHDHAHGQGHGDSHSHSGGLPHGHGHGHHHAPKDFGRAFAIGIALNLVFVAVEAFYGWQSDSLALLADAAHNLSDVGGLVLAWVAIIAGRRLPSRRYTYGLQRGSIIASFINAVILLIAMGSLAYEAVLRFSSPAPIQAGTVIVVAAIGVVVNGVTAWLFMAGGKGDLNIRGAFLLMAGDALVSVGVMMAGGLYLWLGWDWIDPAISLVVALIIIVGTWPLFSQSLHLLFDGVPRHIGLQAVEQTLLDLPGVTAVHDLHVWALATSEFAVTAHLVIDVTCADTQAVLRQGVYEVRERFGIRQATLQLETTAYAQACKTGPTLKM